MIDISNPVISRATITVNYPNKEILGFMADVLITGLHVDVQMILPFSTAIVDLNH